MCWLCRKGMDTVGWFLRQTPPRLFTWEVVNGGRTSDNLYGGYRLQLGHVLVCVHEQVRHDGWLIEIGVLHADGSLFLVFLDERDIPNSRIAQNFAELWLRENRNIWVRWVS